MLVSRADLNNAILRVMSERGCEIGRTTLTWALFDENNVVLASDSYTVGKQPQSVFEGLSSHAGKAKVLFMSMEPAEPYMNVSKLTTLLGTLAIERVVIGTRLGFATHCKQWAAWVNLSSSKVDYLPHSAVSARMSSGMVKARTQGRPWVTCVTAADMTGGEANLTHINSDIGFKSYLAQLVNVNAVVWRGHGVDELTDLIQTVLPAGALRIAIDSGGVKILCDQLNHIASSGACSLCIFCTMSELERLLEVGLVDEIVHHVVSGGSPSDTNVAPLAYGQLDFSDWKLVSSAPLGNGSRIVLINNSSSSVAHCEV